MNRVRPRYATAAEERSRSGRLVADHVFYGDTPTEPQRRWQAWAAGQAQAAPGAPGPELGPNAPPPATATRMTAEQAQVDATLSLLMLEHNEVVRAPDSHESAIDLARHELVPWLDRIVMTATGALHAKIARPDLVANAGRDAGQALAIAGRATNAAKLPLGVTLASQMARAAGTASKLVEELARLPGTTPTPAPGPRPPPASQPTSPGPGPGPVASADEPDEASAARSSSSGKGKAIAIAAGVFGLLALLGRR